MVQSVNTMYVQNTVKLNIAEKKYCIKILANGSFYTDY